jgi:hypothetical protein
VLYNESTESARKGGSRTKVFPGRPPGPSGWPLVIPAGVVVALVAAGIAFGAYFGAQAMDGTTAAQETEEPTATAPAADSTATPAVTAEPSPEPSAPSPVPEATWGPLGCINCPVKGGQQLEVTAEDIQLGPDGKYYVPDRGDGCAYHEGGRGEFLGVQVVSLWAPNCEQGREYEPATGRVHVLIP